MASAAEVMAAAAGQALPIKWLAAYETGDHTFLMLRERVCSPSLCCRLGDIGALSTRTKLFPAWQSNWHVQL